MNSILKQGKLPIKILREIVIKNENKIVRPEILIRPNIGEDCAAFFIDNEICMISTDPITGATENIGYLSVIVNSNDISASGGEAIGIVSTILLPIGTTVSDLEKIINGIYKGCKHINIELIGGHTEVTDSVNRPIVVSTIVGKTKNKNFISTSDVSIGQDIIVTKSIGLEGTSIIATELLKYENHNLNLNLKDLINKIDKLLSVKKEAELAVQFGATSMHDITEGGVLGAFYEIAVSSNKGIYLDLNKIQISEETNLICRKFNLNPYKLISSGSLIIITHKGYELVDILNKNDISAAVVGEIKEKNKEYKYKNEIFDIEEVNKDELYKFFEFI